MSDMVESVARAIYEDRNGNGAFAWSRQTNEHKRPYRSDARAAIEAMREPTDAMYVAALGITRDTRYGPCDDCVGGAAYRAMIAAAVEVQK